MADNKTIHDIVEKSYGLCRMTGTFAADFYSLFLDMSPRIREKFTNTNMVNQQRLLDHGIRHLIRYFHEPDPVTAEKMEALGKSHNKAGLNVEPDLYSLWLDTLLKTVTKHDPDFGPEVESAWRAVAEHGIKTMQAMYDK